jgi:hypothetical protein
MIHKRGFIKQHMTCVALSSVVTHAECMFTILPLHLLGTVVGGGQEDECCT